MSWNTYARGIGREEPVFALDAAGRIQIWTSTVHLLTGIDPTNALGKPWEQVGTAAGRTWLLSRGARTGELALKRQAIRLAIVAWPVSSREHEVDGVMCWVDGVVHRGTPPTSHYCYEIASGESPAGFGYIVRHYGSNPRAIGMRCHEEIAGRPAPCPGCPVASLPLEASRTAVVRGQGGELMVVRATRGSAQTVTVSGDRIGPEVMSRLVHARLDGLADEHGLSHREREVLIQLASGASTEDVAAGLSITPRTVKFHSANVLAKLGLASRLELVRLVFATADAATAASNGAVASKGSATRNRAPRQRERTSGQRPPVRARTPRRG